MELVFSLDNLSYQVACKVERYVKTLTRARKDALISGDPKLLSLIEKRVLE